MRRSLFRAAFPLVALALPVLATPCDAASNCTSKSSPCIDAKTGEARVCTTTTCYDENGKEISSVTVVTKQSSNDTGGAKAPINPKAGTKEPPVIEIPNLKQR
jgi:hypothetical protein